MLFLIRLSHFFWFSHCLLLAGLFVEMIRCRFYHQFPYFTSYTLAAALKSAILLAINRSPVFNGQDYANAFLLGDAVVTPLLFGVIYEVFRHSFRDHPALNRLGSSAFRWVTVTLILFAIALAWFVPSTDSQGVMSAYFPLTRSLNFVQVGLLLFLLLFSRYFHLAFRSYAFGIALGLGVLAASNLGVNALRSQLRPSELSYRLLNAIGGGTYLACVLVWAVYLLKQKKGIHPPVRLVPPNELETWSQELQRLIH
jgi:hypothetical protein